MLNKTLKIALGDLRHNILDMHSAYLPIGIGYIATYTLSQFEPGSVNIRLYVNPEKIMKVADLAYHLNDGYFEEISDIQLVGANILTN